MYVGNVGEFILNASNGGGNTYGKLKYPVWQISEQQTPFIPYNKCANKCFNDYWDGEYVTTFKGSLYIDMNQSQKCGKGSISNKSDKQFEIVNKNIRLLGL